jgi:hypothetical protein
MQADFSGSDIYWSRSISVNRFGMSAKDANAEAKSVTRLSTCLFNLDLHDLVEATLPVFLTTVSAYSLPQVVGNYLISIVSLARSEAENETASQFESMSLRNKGHGRRKTDHRASTHSVWRTVTWNGVICQTLKIVLQAECCLPPRSETFWASKQSKSPSSKMTSELSCGHRVRTSDCLRFLARRTPEFSQIVRCHAAIADEIRE